MKSIATTITLILLVLQPAFAAPGNQSPRKHVLYAETCGSQDDECNNNTKKCCEGYKCEKVGSYGAKCEKK